MFVAAGAGAWMRRLPLRIRGTRASEIGVPSYAEITLAAPASDAAHPAFSNLFIRSEFVPQVAGLVFARRPRATGDWTLYAAHVVAGDRAAGLEFETDRARFIGRGRTVHAPIAISEARPLTHSAAADP